MNYSNFKTEYEASGIKNLPYGKCGAKLGLFCEEYLCRIVNEHPEFWRMYKNHIVNDDKEYNLYCQILDTLPWKVRIRPTATTKVRAKDNGAPSKTDIIISTPFHRCGISVKQSKAAKVSGAEFSADVVIEAIELIDERAKSLIRKHQTDGSAKQFSKEEKTYLRSAMSEYADKLVRWILTGCVKQNNDVRNPDIMVRFKVDKEGYIIGHSVRNIEDEMKNIMYTKNGTRKTAGFGTGASWTRASGSGTSKMQFKI